MEMAKARQLSAVALTDHDTVAGHPEARESADRLGIQFVPGVELEAVQGNKKVHLLGYFVDADSPPLNSLLTRVREMRDSRNKAIAENLSRLGIEIDYAAMSERHAGRAIGRPHFAAELVRKGVVS